MGDEVPMDFLDIERNSIVINLRAEIAQLQFDLRAARQSRDDYIDLMNQYRAQLRGAIERSQKAHQALEDCEQELEAIEQIAQGLAGWALAPVPL